jgi:hypothetical protein
MAIPHIDPGDSHRAGFQNGNFYPSFDVADHLIRFLVQSYGNFKDQ